MVRVNAVLLIVFFLCSFASVGHAKEEVPGIKRQVKTMKTADVPARKPVQVKIPALTGTAPLIDVNKVTAGHCAAAYDEISSAMASAPSPSVIFRNVGVMGETGSVIQGFKCFFEGAAPAVEDAFAVSSLGEEMAKCRYGFRDSRWNRACMHPQDIRDKMDVVKEQLWSRGWTDVSAVNPSLEANQAGGLYYGAFANIAAVPYIEFGRYINGDVMLLRAIAGFEIADQFRRSGSHYMMCVADDISSFANRCR